jgi:hypothetical protein
MIRMPFGKHYGEPLCRVPSRYLAWVLRECWIIDPELRSAIRDEVRRRTANARQAAGNDGDASQGPAGPGNNSGSMAVVSRTELRDIIRRWYRQLAFEYHPDRTQNREAAAAINVARDRLLEALQIE